MPTDQTYFRGVYRPQGELKLVVGSLGRISAAFGSASETPVTGTLGAHVTSATLTGHDWAGSISIVGDGTGTAAQQNLFVVTFSVARTTAPLVYLTTQSGGASAIACTAVPTTSGFTVVNIQAVPATTTFVVAYHLVDIE